MKRVGYLADKVFTRENVRAAWDAYNKNRPVKLRKAFDQRRADRILQAARRDFAAVVANPREKTIFADPAVRRVDRDAHALERRRAVRRAAHTFDVVLVAQGHGRTPGGREVLAIPADTPQGREILPVLRRQEVLSAHSGANHDGAA